MLDALSIPKNLRDGENDSLGAESIRNMNMDGFDIIPDHHTM
jgi:hypothetical protein